MNANYANDTGLPEGVILDIQQCLALVAMSAMALGQVESSPPMAVVERLRRTLDLAVVLGEQGLYEVERIHRHPKTGCRSGC